MTYKKEYEGCDVYTAKGKMTLNSKISEKDLAYLHSLGHEAIVDDKSSKGEK